MRRVVITGMGIWSCIGRNKAEVTESLRAGRSGVGIDDKRTEYGYRSPLTGIVETPDLKPYLNRRLRVGMSQEAMYAYMASREAFEQAKIEDQYLLDNEVGIIFGNDTTAMPTIEIHEQMLATHNRTRARQPRHAAARSRPTHAASCLTQRPTSASSTAS